ncbi:MAG: hypothetical protein PHH13_02510, partial [Candidatus Peribacteraceae bacterium]|nr:hypothetical protein [Candidatus Peribacteraceae bacterium]
MAAAQEAASSAGDHSVSAVAIVAGVIAVGCVLAFLWLGIMNHGFVRHESLSSIEKRQPFLPRTRIIIGTVLATVF